MRRRGGAHGQVGSITEGHEEALGGNGHVPDIDSDDVSWMYTYVSTYNRVYCMYVEFHICLLYHMYNQRGEYCITTVSRNQLSLATDSRYLEK